MSALLWSDEYSVNSAEIDNQHKKLFQLANDLTAAVKRGDSSEAFSETMDALIDYAYVHFAAEEALMIHLNYPNTPSHLAQHAYFINKLCDFQAVLPSGKVGLDREVLEFVETWISTHILENDKKYAPYLRS